MCSKRTGRKAPFLRATEDAAPIGGHAFREARAVVKQVLQRETRTVSLERPRGTGLPARGVRQFRRGRPARPRAAGDAASNLHLAPEPRVLCVHTPAQEGVESPWGKGTARASLVLLPPRR